MVAKRPEKNSESNQSATGKHDSRLHEPSCNCRSLSNPACTQSSNYEQDQEQYTKSCIAQPGIDRRTQCLGQGRVQNAADAQSKGGDDSAVGVDDGGDAGVCRPNERKPLFDRPQPGLRQMLPGARGFSLTFIYFASLAPIMTTTTSGLYLSIKTRSALPQS